MALSPKIKDIIVEQLGVRPRKVKTEASFIDDLGADSLDIVELVMAMEEIWSWNSWWRCWENENSWRRC